MSLLAHTHWPILATVAWGCLSVAAAIAVLRLHWLAVNDLRREWRRRRQQRADWREWRRWLRQ